MEQEQERTHRHAFTLSRRHVCRVVQRPDLRQAPRRRHFGGGRVPTDAAARRGAIFGLREGGRGRRAGVRLSQQRRAALSSVTLRRRSRAALPKSGLSTHSSLRKARAL
eukprot:scaffold7310_cov116-Isochrysis_galbana.AAC.5